MWLININMKQEELKINDYYSTQDLGLATAISLFYPLELIERTPNSNKAKFVFKRTDEEFDKAIEAYWRGELQWSLLAFFNQLKIIKSRLYER
jgi:hypothetical protein